MMSNTNVRPNATAPFMSTMMPDPQADDRVLQFAVTKCLMFCYLFFVLSSIPIAAFVLWIGSLPVWLGGLIMSTCAVYAFLPSQSVSSIKHVVYGSLLAGVCSAAFGTIVSSNQTRGWISAYALLCGIQEGLFAGAAIKLVLYGRYLRSQGLHV